MEHGWVFNIQRYSIQDGPGIRTTLFFKGCPLRCVWCHNPEGISPNQELLFLEDRCLECKECARVCPQATAGEGAAAGGICRETCVRCGACVVVCPTEARQMAGRELTVDEALREIERDRIFFEESAGGVTFSGGEPLMQPRFLRALLAGCRRAGIHTAVDTSGWAAAETVLGMAPLTDLFLYDLKIMDPARHRQYTGVSNELIRSNLETLGRAHANLWVRIPLIAGINDGAEELEAMARFVGGIPGVRQVNLLPYHKIGLQKCRRLGQTPPREGLEPPSAESMDRAQALFQAVGVGVQVGS